MFTSVLASAALLASSALAGSVGEAIVINGCTYDVHLCAVPASGGGQTETDKVLSPNETFTQEWTQLSNLQGWSIKLSKDASLANILQYEYTFHNDGIIWYDLSCVNGNPWDGDWEITANNGCSPKQQAYRYATDDAYGMQSCTSDASITVTLCSGESQNDGLAASVSASVAHQSGSATSAASIVASSPAVVASSPVVVASSPVVVQSSSAAPAATHTSAAAASPAGHSPAAYSGHQYGAGEKEHNVAASPTTLATSITRAYVGDGGHVVTEVDTAVVTEYVTATAAAAKRHEHHAAHPHFLV